MIFSEIYSVYYQTVSRVLSAALSKPLDRSELINIIRENAFDESTLSIEPALTEGRWPLLKADGSPVLKHEPSMPLTDVEKRWLKAISLDPRIRLFDWDLSALTDVEPLFTPEDYCIFDKYSDGDPYDDEHYINNFRLILDAIRNKTPLIIMTENRRGGLLRQIIMPEYLEYSEKDDKFRVQGRGSKVDATVNLARIKSCEIFRGNFVPGMSNPRPEQKTLEFEVYRRRNAPERVLLHFAHFEKEAERLDDFRYRVRLKYSAEDETELVIRILSFGPLVKVNSPVELVDEIKARLISQKNCGQ